MKKAQFVRIVSIAVLVMLNNIILNGQSVKTEHEIRFQNWMNTQHSISILPSVATTGQIKLILPPLLPSVASFLAVGTINGSVGELEWREDNYISTSGFVGSPTAFIGTTNSSPLRLFTDNTERFRITESGKFLFNDTNINDSVLVQINGDVTITQDLVVQGEVSASNITSIPAGTIIMFAGASEPNGWLICDGRAVSRVDNQNLFDAIGVIYGNGDGSTTFNLPNLGGRVPIGANATYTLATTGGEDKHTLSVEEMPTHRHTLQVKSTAAAGLPNSNRVFSGTASFHDQPATIGLHTSTLTTTGGGLPHNNMQPYITLNYIIKK